MTTIAPGSSRSGRPLSTTAAWVGVTGIEIAFRGRWVHGRGRRDEGCAEASTARAGGSTVGAAGRQKRNDTDPTGGALAASPAPPALTAVPVVEIGLRPGSPFDRLLLSAHLPDKALEAIAAASI